MMGKKLTVNNAKSIDLLGMKYRPLEESLRDMGRMLKK